MCLIFDMLSLFLECQTRNFYEMLMDFLCLIQIEDRWSWATWGVFDFYWCGP